MAIFSIYYERADHDKEQVYIGDMQAETMSDAIDMAAQYYKVPLNGLIAVQVDEETLQKCPWCQEWHEPQLIDACPLKPKH